MSLILNIDTALEDGSVCLAKNGEVLQTSFNSEQKDHAAWLQPAVDKILKESGFKFQDVSAIAVSNGPGSYTGLRIGLASAKGFCYALNIPLITVSTLKILACAVQEQAVDLICPLIDARRMEVYAAVYDKELREKVPPHALIINDSVFSPLLASHHILFCGNGSKKLQPIISSDNAVFSSAATLVHSFARLSQKYFSEKIFADLAYAEPLYLKEFYTPARKGQ